MYGRWRYGVHPGPHIRALADDSDIIDAEFDEEFEDPTLLEDRGALDQVLQNSTLEEFVNEIIGLKAAEFWLERALGVQEWEAKFQREVEAGKSTWEDSYSEWTKGVMGTAEATMGAALDWEAGWQALTDAAQVQNKPRARNIAEGWTQAALAWLDVTETAFPSGTREFREAFTKAVAAAAKATAAATRLQADEGVANLAGDELLEIWNIIVEQWEIAAKNYREVGEAAAPRRPEVALSAEERLRQRWLESAGTPPPPPSEVFAQTVSYIGSTCTLVGAFVGGGILLATLGFRRYAVAGKDPILDT